jgi:hypothetical protein
MDELMRCDEIDKGWIELCLLLVRLRFEVG